MTRPTRSLAFQLILAFMVVQSACIVLAMIAFPIIAPFTTYRSISDKTARMLVVDSIQPDRDGVLQVVPTAALRAYAATRPFFGYAAKTADGRIMAGSSVEMADLLQKTGRFTPRKEDAIETVRPGRPGDVVFISTHASRFGYVMLAISGDEFHADNLRTFLATFLPAVLPAYGPVFLGMLLGVPFVLRRTLRPIRHAASAASLIDIRALDHRLPTDRLPTEFQPLVNAVNDALDRLSGGWTRQRLFTANAAHELRTPVTVLQARVETLPADTQLRSALIRDVRRLALLIDQLLAIARLEEREIPLRPLELVALTRDVVADWAPVAINGGRALGLSSQTPAIWVLGDAQALEGAIAALIDNALKVEPLGGTVEVSVCPGASIKVRDHGPGVAMTDREMVFEPFWRKTEEPFGSGLGLATVRETARILHGRVYLEERSDEGACFVFEIPEQAASH
jgi:signal transduction histidine kinase